MEAEHDASALARAVFAQFDAFAVDELWPGFDPRSVPVALFDGERTWLREYPGLPSRFTVDGAGSLLVFGGRHPAVLANSVVELDGVMMATVMIDPATSGGPAEIAALALHEAFHVFQQCAFPQWTGDEAALFAYPFDAESLVTAALIEEWALAHALAAADPAGWAVTALRARAERHAAMPPDAVGWERQTELVEGTAHAVELRALGRAPRAGSAAASLQEVRQRCYRVGALLAMVLGRVEPEWRGNLGPAAGVSLDHVLANVPGIRDCPPVAVSREQHAQARRAARLVIAAEAESRRTRREEVLAKPGHLLEIVAAPGTPLRAHGFDPMNVAVLGPGEILHSRYLHLTNGAATIEVHGGEAITQAAGEHPLFDGVRVVTLAGLPELPSVGVAVDGVHLDLPWLRLHVRGGNLETSSSRTRVHL